MRNTHQIFNSANDFFLAILKNFNLGVRLRALVGVGGNTVLITDLYFSEPFLGWCQDTSPYFASSASWLQKNGCALLCTKMNANKKSQCMHEDKELPWMLLWLITIYNLSFNLIIKQNYFFIFIVGILLGFEPTNSFLFSFSNTLIFQDKTVWDLVGPVENLLSMHISHLTRVRLFF